MLTRALFTAIVLLVALGAMRDWAISKNNTYRLLDLGAGVFGNSHTRLYLVLVWVWSVGGILEVLFLGRAFSLLFFAIGAVLALCGQILRRAARNALGQRWTCDIVSLPGNPLVTGQIYDRMRHPEYAGTFLLFIGVPMLHGAWITFFFSLAAGVMLIITRVRLEEAVLGEDARYQSAMGDRPRFLPRRIPVSDREPSRPTRFRPRSRRGDLPGV